MEITWANHSGYKTTEKFADRNAALAHLREVEAADRRVKEVAPTSSGRIDCDRWFKMVAFRKALGLPEYRYSS